MSNTSIPLDVAAAEDHLMRFLSVEGVTGQEKNIGLAVCDVLRKIGVPETAIRFDDANKRIPLPTETGNLIVDIPGTRPGPRLLFPRTLTRCHFALAPSLGARATASSPTVPPRWAATPEPVWRFSSWLPRR